MASDDAGHSSSLVLDSSFLIASHNSRDAHHESATALMERITAGEWAEVVLLEYVVLEVLTVLRMRLDAAAAISVGELLLDSREIQFRPCSDIFLAAFETLGSEPRAELSFVDAAIVTVAREADPGYVATFDRDFEDLAGVTVIPIRIT